MTVFDVVSSPWAIEPHKFQEVLEVYRRHASGEGRHPDALFGIKERSAEEREAFEVRGGVAILPLGGVLGKKFNMLTDFSGGTSTQVFRTMLDLAMADDAVQAILIHVDSPGGTVDGTQDLAHAVFRARGQGKPIVTFTDGMMASAALWIGLAADEVVIANDTTQVGSIGVVATHRDISKAEEQMGIKTTEVVSSRYKRLPSHLAPLSREGEQLLQSEVDHLHRVFVGDLAKFRGVEVEALADAADGRIFLGLQAIEKQLVDRVDTFDAVLRTMQSPMTTRRVFMKGTSTNATTKDEGTVIETAADLQRAFPDLCQAMTQAAHEAGLEAGRANGVTAGRIEGAQNERARIQQVEAQAQGFPGHTDLIQAMKYDGATSPQEAAVKVLEAERSLKTRAVQDLHDEAPKPVKGQFSQDSQTESAAQRRDRIIEAYQAEHGASYKAALLATAKAHPELFEAAAG